MNNKLIYMKDFSKEQILEIYNLADRIENGELTDRPLAGKTIVLFFPESSIRTRVTFEKGIQDMGGHTILFPPSALDKKEEIRDVIGYLENWADAVVVRHSNIEVVKELAANTRIPVINAMTSVNHPCEILTDMYGLSKKYREIKNKKFLYMGVNGNIGNSWKAASEIWGFELEQCCPEGYELDNIKIHREISEAVKGKDIICTDSIPDKAKEDFKGYQVTLSHMQHANDGVILNPCPPFYRGEEVSDDAINSECFVGYEFKKHLVSVQQAIIYYLINQERI